MPNRDVALSQVVSGTAAVATPGALVLGALVLWGGLEPVAALLGFGPLVAALALLTRHQLAILQAVRGYGEDLVGGSAEPPAAARRYGIARDLVAALTKLHRWGRDQIDELRALVETRESVLDSVPDPLLTLDQNGRIVRANLSARLLLGKLLDGRDLSSVLRNPVILDAVAAVLAGGSARVVDLSLSDPVERDFSVGVQPLPMRAPDGTTALLAMHDVTSLRRAEQMRADFVANASHELRTPLASLVGFIETLRGPARDDEDARDRFLGIMQEQATRMGRLVADLLSLSRIELNEHLPPTQAVALDTILATLAATFELQAARRKVRLQVDCPASLPRVVADEDELAQLFQNLIDNALKYGRPGSVVRIAATRPARLPAGFPRAPHGAVAVAVADEGDGIEREHLPRLTERFYRVDPARSKQAGGTGLGLAIVKHIVSRHRGALTIESEVGRGSTFTVFLPAAAAARPGARVAEAGG
ncbi:MAG: PAS domain-containing protein [Proteobacteria bacterium]|nr:PAS domain-containing protein [Pseudomonadota bacterium]